jgi:DNA-binding transcriptional LysR family regulator
LSRNSTRPPLTLTSAGEALFERAKVLFAVAEEIDAILGEDDLESGAILRLGTDSPPFAAEFMAAFQQKSAANAVSGNNSQRAANQRVADEGAGRPCDHLRAQG